MTILYYFDGHNNQFEVTTLDENIVTETFNMLDGDKYREIMLSNSLGRLHIIGLKQNRMVVIFRDDGRHTGTFYGGTLMDLTMEDDRMEFLLGNGEVQIIDLSETVTHETALKVLLHLFKHNELSKGLRWKGDMSYFE